MSKGIGIVIAVALKALYRVYDGLPRPVGRVATQVELGKAVESLSNRELLNIKGQANLLSLTVEELLVLRQQASTPEDYALAWKEAHLIMNFLTDLANGKLFADTLVTYGVTKEQIAEMMKAAIGTDHEAEIITLAEALYPKVEVAPTSLELPVAEELPAHVEPMQYESAGDTLGTPEAQVATSELELVLVVPSGNAAEELCDPDENIFVYAVPVPV